jgi:multiple antibiotic resistance protein
MFDLNQLLDWTEYTKLLIGLLAIASPLSAIPIFLGLTSDRTPAERQRIALVAASVAAATLLVFTFLGKALLSLFGITIEAFQIAGGILLLLMALGMMGALPGATTSDESDSSGRASIGIVPLAIPLLAGPGAISTILIYAHRHESLAHDLLVSGVIISVMTIVFLTLRLSTVIGPKLGKTGISVLNRIMGLIVAAIAVEFIVDGLAARFPALVR